MDNNVEDYPVASLWYTILAIVTIGVLGIVVAFALGHSVGNSILRAGV